MRLPKPRIRLRTLLALIAMAGLAMGYIQARGRWARFRAEAAVQAAREKAYLNEETLWRSWASAPPLADPKILFWMIGEDSPDELRQWREDLRQWREPHPYELPGRIGVRSEFRERIRDRIAAGALRRADAAARLAEECAQRRRECESRW